MFLIPFIGINVQKQGASFHTSVHHKATDTGLLLHYHSHTDIKYKRSLLRTMITRAFRLSSSWNALHQECEILSNVFKQLKYPINLIQRTIKDVIDTQRNPHPQQQPSDTRTAKPTRLVLPFKSAKASQQVKQALKSINQELRCNLQPVFTAHKVGDLVCKPPAKDKIVSASRVVYQYNCATCDMCYVGYTQRHLHQRVAEHRRPASTIAKHCSDTGHAFSDDQFTIITKCSSKLELMIRESHEIFFRKPQLNARDEYSCCLLYKLRL